MQTLRRMQAKYGNSVEDLPSVVVTVREPKATRPESTAASLPIEILLEVFSHLGDHPALDIFLDNLQYHHPLALTSLDLGQPFWSPKAFDKQNLINAALTCKLWSHAAIALLPTTVKELSRLDVSDVGNRVKACAWTTLSGGKKKNLLALGSLRVSSRRRSSLSSSIDVNVFSYTSIPLPELSNLRVLFLSTVIVSEIYRYSHEAPLANLKCLQSLTVCNISPKKLYTPLGTLDMEAVAWILAGTNVASLELYDPNLVPGHIGQDSTALNFPERLTSLVLCARDCTESPEFPLFLRQIPNLKSLTIGLFAKAHAALDLSHIPKTVSTLNLLNLRAIEIEHSNESIRTLRCLSFVHPRQTVLFPLPWPSVEHLAFSFEINYASDLLRKICAEELSGLKRLEVHTSQAGLSDPRSEVVLMGLREQCIKRGIGFEADKSCVTACLVSKHLNYY